MEERPNSAATVIEIENPTGYVVYQLEAEESIRIAQKSTFPSIRDVIGGHSDFYQTKTVWFFDYVSYYLKGFNPTLVIRVILMT